MTPQQARRRFAAARVAHLATTDSTGQPHIVPITFAVHHNTIYSAVDAKPKRSTTLKRLSNLTANPAAALLVDHYSEDWNQLWWVRADGTARLLHPQHPEAQHAITLLHNRYPHFTARGTIIAIDIHHWTSWTATPTTTNND
jgi:PPOX class probable F420-dependent enzyme